MKLLTLCHMKHRMLTAISEAKRWAGALEIE